MTRTMPLLALLLLAAGPCLAQTPAAPASPGTMAPGSMSPGSMPSGAMPHGSMPPGSMSQGAMPQGAMPGMHAGAPGADAPSTQAYRDAMMKMHQAMDIPYTGDADQDFVAGMMPHHQGAVDKAKVELRYGRDPALRRLAQDIIKAQVKEIAFMRQWQAKHPR